MWKRKKKRIEIDKTGKLHVVELGDAEIQEPEQPQDAVIPPAKQDAMKPSPVVEEFVPEIPRAEQTKEPRTVRLWIPRPNLKYIHLL